MDFIVTEAEDYIDTAIHRARTAYEVLEIEENDTELKRSAMKILELAIDSLEQAQEAIGRYKAEDVF